MGKYSSSEDEYRRERIRGRSSSIESYKKSRKTKHSRESSRSRYRHSSKDRRNRRSYSRSLSRSDSREKYRRSRDRKNRQEKRSSRSRSRSISKKSSKKKKSKRSRSRSRRSPSESSTRSSFTNRHVSRSSSLSKTDTVKKEVKTAVSETHKVEKKASFEENLARSRAIEAIESEEFNLSSFSSSREAKKEPSEDSGLFNFGTQAEKTMMGNSFASKINNLNKEELMHSSLFLNQEERDKKWLKFLFHHRKTSVG